MTFLHVVLATAWLDIASPVKPLDRAVALDAGALSYLLSTACQQARDGAAVVMQWPGLLYAPQKAPAWGTRPVESCRPSLYHFTLAAAAGALWAEVGAEAVQADPMRTLFDAEKTRAALKKELGVDIPDREGVTPSDFSRYDGKKLQKLVDRYYVPPSTAMGGLTAQSIYDVVAKEYVARFAHEVAVIYGKVPRNQLAKLAKDYKAAAKSQGSGFSGTEYLKKIGETTFPEEENAGTRSGRVLGVILRRTSDGSWPTVQKALKKVITAYDPPLAQELAGKL